MGARPNRSAVGMLKMVIRQVAIMRNTFADGRELVSAPEL